VARRCVKCGGKYKLERHHVIYKPEQVAVLCRRCHKLITAINTLAAQKYGTNKEKKTAFTNVVRLALWHGFLSGAVKLKVVKKNSSCV